MPNLNKDALDIWNALRPMIDKEIERRTRGTVQRRKAKVTTAPSLVTNKIGVTEPFGDQYFIPFNTNLSTAKVGDVVWVEFMYGATNAFASMYATADTKDVTVGGVLDVVQRRCSATLSSTGWYRVLSFDTGELRALTNGLRSAIVTIKLLTSRGINNQTEEHEIKYVSGSHAYPFVDEISVSSTTLWIDKIRSAINSGADYCAIDIHFIGTSATNVTGQFDVAVDPDGQQYFTAGTLASVADAPAGETVLTTYSFQDNTPNRRTYIGVIQANSSISVPFSTLATAKAARGSNSPTFVDAIADTWGGVSYSARMDTLAIVTSSGNIVTITNKTQGVMNYIIETY